MAKKPVFYEGKPLFKDGKPMFADDPCDCCGEPCPPDPDPGWADFDFSVQENCDDSTWLVALTDISNIPDGWELYSGSGYNRLWDVTPPSSPCQSATVAEGNPGNGADVSGDVSIVAEYPGSEVCCEALLQVVIQNIEHPTCLAVDQITKTIKICNALADDCETYDCADLPDSLTIAIDGTMTWGGGGFFTCSPPLAHNCDDALSVIVDRISGCSWGVTITELDYATCNSNVSACLPQNPMIYMSRIVAEVTVSNCGLWSASIEIGQGFRFTTNGPCGGTTYTGFSQLSKISFGGILCGGAFIPTTGPTITYVAGPGCITCCWNVPSGLAGVSVS